MTGLEGQGSTIELLPHLSERPDSNRRPQRPERCALTKLRHSPILRAAAVAAARRHVYNVTKTSLAPRTSVTITRELSSSPEMASFQSSTDTTGS